MGHHIQNHITSFRHIEVTNLQTEQKHVFLAGRWLSVEKNDGLVSCLLPVATKSELSDFNYLFGAKATRDLRDAHLWFSVYARPPRSSFTRCQRLSVAVSLLLCSMVANAMFYGRLPQTDPKHENRIGDLKFTWQQVIIL